MPQPSWLTGQLIVSAITIFVMVHVILISVAYLVQAERKVSAYIQDRIGPNRTGFDFGLPALSWLKGCLGFGQPLADGIKFMLKEDYTPNRVDKILFTLAPIIVVVPALMGFIVIPWGGIIDLPTFTIPFLNWTSAGGPVHIAGASVNIGIVYLLATAALGVYGITLGGYASNNKYSFLGSLRASAQMISYEIPMGLALLCAIMLAGTFSAHGILQYQEANGWLIISQPIAALIFFIAILAEANRAPFDNAEAEQELVGGYHTEYSSMRFALYFLAEYAHLFTSSAFFVLLFMGGYQALPFIDVPGLSTEDTVWWAAIAKFAIFFGKVVTVAVFTMVIRWTIPRLRYDQVMTTAWNMVIPISLACVVATAVMVYLGQTTWLPMLLVNIGLVVLTIAVLPFIPKSEANRRLPLYGSRFSPVVGEKVRTQSDNPVALEDRPVQGIA
jgi:NADH-quinone oxidoreductase subunit H